MPVIKDALTPINHRAGGCTPKWIVVHYFGALGSAASVAEWFKNPQARASAMPLWTAAGRLYQHPLEPCT